jgi:hypothetical protein
MTAVAGFSQPAELARSGEPGVSYEKNRPIPGTLGTKQMTQNFGYPAETTA